MDFVSSRTQRLFFRSYDFLGHAIFRRPWLFFISGILLTIICSLGMLFMQTETNGFNLWIPTQSAVYKRYRYMLDTFGTEPSIVSLIFTVEDGDSVLAPAHLNSIYEAYNAIYNVSLFKNGEEYSYSDVCLRAYPTAENCASDSAHFFANFYIDPYLSAGYPDTGDLSFLWSNETAVLSFINSPLTGGLISYFASDFTYDSNGDITKSGIMRLWFELLGTTDDEVI